MRHRRWWPAGLAAILAFLLLAAPPAWAPGNCTVFKTFGTNEVLTSSDLNNSLTQAAVTNSTTQCLDDYSATATQMQATTDPGEAGSESLATALSGELERLRFAIKETKDALGTSVAQWYSSPTAISAATKDRQFRNLLINGDLEDWRNGTSVEPFGWTKVGAGSTVARDGTNFKISTFSASLTRAGTDTHLERDAIAQAGGQGYIRGRQYRYSAWVRATVASRVRLRLNDAIGSTFSSYHTGGGTFELLTVTRTVDAAGTALKAGLQIDTGDTNGQIDGAMLVEGDWQVAFAPRPEDLDPSFDPATTFEFYEDFEAISLDAAPGASAIRESKYSWRISGDKPGLGQGVGGRWRVAGDGTNSGDLALNKDQSATPTLIVNADRKPFLRVRWAQASAANEAGTRRIGLAGGPLNADPTNGIYFRHAVNGNIIAVCRAAGVESTLDTAVAAATGTFHRAAIEVRASNQAVVFLDGVEKGTITTNIPTANIGPTAGSGAANGGTGLDIDYFYVKQGR